MRASVVAVALLLSACGSSRIERVERIGEWCTSNQPDQPLNRCIAERTCLEQPWVCDDLGELYGDAVTDVDVDIDID